MAKTNVEQHVQFQEYTNYIDTSDVMLGFYKNQSGTGLEKYILMIEDWLNIVHENVQDNKPLVLQADGGVGKKTLLNKWYQYHESLKQEKKKDLILLHFATTGGNNSNYFYAIYRILIKLRETLNIGQKVELHEEKLRKYFSYWLQVCNDSIQSQSINNPEIIYQKIILVFEGIDYFVDRDTNKQGNIAFWLPKYFPKNIKVIVTADRQSETMKHFTRLTCQKVKLPLDNQIIKNMIKKHSEKKLCVSESVKSTILSSLEDILLKHELINLYVKSYLTCLLPQQGDSCKLTELLILQINNMLQNLDSTSLKNLHSIDNLFDFILQFWSKRIFKTEQKFKQILALLICTQKGLTKSEILLISKISIDELKIFITVFRSFLMNFKHLWMIKNDSFRRCINKKYKFKFQEIHEKIAESLRKTPNSLRKLEEQTYQLYNAKSYFKLKQIISDVENFLLLFNPYNKYDLCRYWQKLQQKSFDPVIEYNKAVQNFEMHYHPSSEDLFRITVQISRFLKEFADFETYYTPKFRHPEILGNLKEMDDIGLLGEFLNLSLCEIGDQVVTKDDTNNGNKGSTETLNGERDLKEKVKEMLERLEKGRNIKKELLNEKKQQGFSKQAPLKQENKKKKKDTIIQQSNVEVKSNQANFREYYYKQIQGFLKKVSLDNDQQSNQESNHIEEETHSDDEDYGNNALLNKNSNNITDISKSKLDKQKTKQYQYSNLRKLFSDSAEEEFELNQRPPTNYYYKRWIWMQFPWVCMTMKCDYSAKIKRCFTSPTQYMTVSEEKEFTIQSLKIALEAKKKKQSVLEQKNMTNNNNGNSTLTKQFLQKGMQNSKSSLNPLNTKYDRQGTRFNEEIPFQMQVKPKKKIEELAYLTSSFLNLQNLTKEIQNINLTKTTTNKKAGQKYSIESESSVFLTQTGKHQLNASSSFLHASNSNKSVLNKLTIHEPDISSSKIKQGLLPRIKQTMNTEMQKQLQILEKNNASMRKEMDYYLYMNKNLAKKLKELKIIEFNNQSQLKNVKKIDQTKQKIIVLQQKLQKIKYQYAYSLLQQQRLNILIKICKSNKTQNQEAIPPLTFECNNFKKMIKWEKQAINQINRETEEIKKISNKFIINCNQKRENQINLSEEIKSTLKNRTLFESQVQKYDEMINSEVENQRKKLESEVKDILVKNQQKDIISSTLEKNKKVTQVAENYELMYKQLSQHITLENEGYKHEEKYIRFLEGLNKKRELMAIIEQRKQKLEELQKIYKEEERSMETLQKVPDQNGKVLEESADQEEQQRMMPHDELLYYYERDIHEKQRIYNKLLQTRLSCIGMLNTWQAKINIKRSQDLVISEQFYDKIKELATENAKTVVESNN